MLGRLTPNEFLRKHWQKKPLLVRQAIPGFQGIVDRDALLALAERDDVRSRLVIQHPKRKQRWERHDGPFASLDASMLPDDRWTLLVNGLESLVPGGWELLRRFDFIPSARVDDLMVSYATDGGGVGPHDDAYDVFLLQGPGRRRWQIQTGGDRSRDPRASIKVLARFEPEEDWVLEPGDMLYLPPGVAHHGVAEGECFTYSIGFLAPSRAELVKEFFAYLAQGIDPDDLYTDPDLRPPKDPLVLDDKMVERVVRMIRSERFTPGNVADFLGRWLTSPKLGVRFTPSARRGKRITLALPSRGLVRHGQIYLNGQAFPATPLLRQLIAERSIDARAKIDAKTRAVLDAWWAAGWIT